MTWGVAPGCDGMRLWGEDSGPKALWRILRVLSVLLLEIGAFTARAMIPMPTAYVRGVKLKMACGLADRVVLEIRQSGGIATRAWTATVLLQLGDGPDWNRIVPSRRRATSNSLQPKRKSKADCLRTRAKAGSR